MVVVPGVAADDVKLNVKKLVGVVTTKVLKIGVECRFRLADRR